MTIVTIEAPVKQEEESTRRRSGPRQSNLKPRLSRSSLPSSNGSNGAGKSQPYVLPSGDHLPDHTQLPCSDGAIVNNFVEPPQGDMLTSSIEPILDQLHPDGQYLIGRDSGIYWKLTEPVLDGAKAPDWFYVPNRPQMLDGQARGSYVLWREQTRPMLVIEFVSDDLGKEHDQTSETGKFWIYEQAICATYYAIYDPRGAGSLEVYRLHNGRYRRIEANERNHYPIPEMRLELGLRLATYQRMHQPWLRAWDLQGNLLLDADERAESNRIRAEAALNEAERLKEYLRSVGIDPESVLGKQ